MSFNQWKVFNQLRDTITKLTNEKSFQNSIKDLSQLVPVTLLTKKFLNDNINDQKLTTFARKSKDGVPKWKQPNNIRNSTISSRTDFVLQSIDTSAPNDNYLLERLETLVEHLKHHPESKNKTIHVGAIRVLLKLRSKCRNNDEEVLGVVREALALLGHVDPVRGRGVRILAIDGGGIRGLLVLEMMKKLEELTGKRIYELFDLLCGVSTGSIICYSLGIHRRSLDEVSSGYESISKDVFKQNAIRGTSKLVWSHAYYDTSLWEAKLQEHLGSEKLISTARNKNCPKICAVSAVVNQSRVSAYVFRNYSLPWRFQSHYMGGHDYAIWEAARASAAAPTYFDEFKLGQLLHQDGGIFVNNPTAIALHEAKLLWPDARIQCVVSFGTGRTVPTPNDAQHAPAHDGASSSWADKFYTILDSATDTEAVHTMLNDLLPDHVYYRFNPYLTEMISMVEIDGNKLEQLKRDALMYLRRNEDKFQEAAKVLMQQKTIKQQFVDCVNVEREKYGF